MPVTLCGMARRVTAMKFPIAAIPHTPNSRGSVRSTLNQPLMTWKVWLCSDEGNDNEDARIELVDLYIQ